MSDKAQTEPSMEEILASIRRIIAEDGDAKAEPAPARAPGSDPDIAEEEEVLELTEVIEEPVAEQEVEDTMEPSPRRPPARAGEEGSGDRLVSAPAAAASVAALSQLAALSAKRDGLGLGNGQLTNEELVRDLLRAMLSD